MNPHRWLPARLVVRPREVHVVTMRLDVPGGDEDGVLDTEELARARRFAFERDRRRFVNAHVGLRGILGACLGRPAASLRFVADRRGKPRLLVPPCDLRFNLSHAGERALAAVALGREVGIDIEQERSIEVLDLATRFFARREIDDLRGLPDEEQRRAFFRCWARKEAFIKALGDGVAFPLDSFEVSVTRSRARQLLRGCRKDPSMVQRWRLVAVAADDGYSAALAAEGSDWETVLWRGPM